MSVLRQNPLLERLAEHPPRIEGGRIAVRHIEGGTARLQIELGGQRVDLLASVLAVPYPSGLKRLADSNPNLEAVIVERIPPGLDQAARELGLGYLDIRGRGRIVGPGFVYFAPPAAAESRQGAPRRTSPFAHKASRVTRCLLSDHEMPWRLSDIARLTGLNPGNVHRVLNTLVEDGYVERDEDRYLVADPGSLLDAWAEGAPPVRERTVVPIKGDLRPAVEALVDRFQGHAVVSGELAAELLAPHLPATSATIHCLDPSEWARLDLEEIEPPPPADFRVPGRLLLDLPDEGVAQFGMEVSHLHLVSPAQLYVDLYKQPTRGRQAAEEARRQLLDF
jgi:IclR helix-turn-helix domain